MLKALTQGDKDEDDDDDEGVEELVAEKFNKIQQQDLRMSALQLLEKLVVPEEMAAMSKEITTLSLALQKTQVGIPQGDPNPPDRTS